MRSWGCFVGKGAVRACVQKQWRQRGRLENFDGARKFSLPVSNFAQRFGNGRLGRNSVSKAGGSAWAPRSRSSFAGGETVRCRGERSQSAALTLGTRRKRHAKPGKLSRPVGAGDLLHGRSQGCAPASLALGWLVSGPWPEPHWTHFASRPIPAGVTKCGAVQGLLVFAACGRGGG
jgi:hypothetical protein